MGRSLLLILAAAAVTLLAAVPALAQGNEVTIRFELTVEGEPPADATFFGQYLVEGATVRLTDPDGDGVYTGSMAGGTPDAGFRIVQGTGAEKTMTGVYPGEPVTVIEDFPAPDVAGGAATLSSAVSFEGAGEPARGTVSATGVLEKPQMTTYMYGTHAVTDEATGTSYALSSEELNLDEYVGRRVTVSGELVPGYDQGQVEGGPPLIEVTSAEPAGGGDGQQVAVAFEITIDGEVPEGASVFVESAAITDGLVCGAGDEACRGGGATERLEVPIPAGEPFDYEILADPGGQAPAAAIAGGSEVAEDGLVVEASHSFASASDGEDVNGDGVVDEADDETAARISDDARQNIDPNRNPLPVTGGVALLILLAGSALAAAGYFARRAMR